MRSMNGDRATTAASRYWSNKRGRKRPGVVSPTDLLGGRADELSHDQQPFKTPLPLIEPARQKALSGERFDPVGDGK